MRFVGRIRTKLDNYPFNQTRSYPTWREANSLPYSGLSKNLLCKLQFRKVAEQTADKHNIQNRQLPLPVFGYSPCFVFAKTGAISFTVI